MIIEIQALSCTSRIILIYDDLTLYNRKEQLINDNNQLIQLKL